MATRFRLRDVERELEELRTALDYATGSNQTLNRENSALRQHISKLEACSPDPSSRCCVASASSQSPPGSPIQERGRSPCALGTAGVGRGMGSVFLQQGRCDAEAVVGRSFIANGSLAGWKSPGERSLSFNSSRWLHSSSASGRASPRVGDNYPCLAQTASGISFAAAPGMLPARLRGGPSRRQASVASDGRSISPGPRVVGGTVAVPSENRPPMSPPLRVRSNSPAPPTAGLSTIASSRPAICCSSTLPAGQVISAGAATVPTPLPVAPPPAWAPAQSAAPTLLGPYRRLAAAPMKGAQPMLSPRIAIRCPTPLR